MIQCFTCGGVAVKRESGMIGTEYGCSSCGRKLLVDGRGAILVLHGDEWKLAQPASE